jgi:integrase
MEHNPIGPAMLGWLQQRARLGELTPATITTYRTHLASFLTHVGPDRELATVTTDDIEAWLASMDVSPATRNTRAATVRSFYAWATARELVVRDPCRLMARAKVPRSPAKRARADDLAVVLAHANGRDRTLVLVALQCFLRRGELAGLQVEDWHTGSAELYVRRGKGGHARVVPVPAEAAAALAAWVAVLGRRSGPMWPSSHRPGQGLAPRTISALVKAAGDAVDVKLWTHLLRHTGLSDAAEEGADYVALARVAGHEDPATTMRTYSHPRGHQLRAAVEGRRYSAAS